MFATPALRQAFRQVTGRASPAAARFVSPLAIATARNVQIRSQHFTAVPADSPEAEKDLIKQRLHRPVSPHLKIYQPQIPWILSSMHRVSGIMLSGPIYLFGAAYVLAPSMGWHLETQSLAAAFAAWPLAAKVGLKSFFAFPFVFHSLNGVRHLVWDMGFGFGKKQVIKSGWTVVALSVISAVGLVMAF